MTTSITTWEDVHQLAEAACRQFKLRWPVVLQPITKRPLALRCKWKFGDCTYRHCASCHCDPVIRMRLRGRNGKVLSKATLVSVLAHELAHLKHYDHTAAHSAFTVEIVDWLQALGHTTTPCMLVDERRVAAKVRQRKKGS